LSLDPKYIERCRGIVKFLDNTIKNLAVYPPEHPSVKGVSQRAYDFLMEVLEGRDEILVGITNGVLNVDEYFFSEATSYSENFMKTLNAFEIDNLVITNGVTLEDVLKLAGVLGSTDRGKEAFLSLAQEQKLRHIGPRGFSLQEDDDPAAGIINIYRHAVNAVTGFFTQIREGRLPLLEDALSLVDGFLKFLPTDRDALLLLTSLKGYERYTAQHCVNVCLLAMLLAEEEGLDERDVGWAAGRLEVDVDEGRFGPESPVHIGEHPADHFPPNPVCRI